MPADVDSHEFKASKLKVCDQEFSVAYNYPYVSQLTMPTIILVGFDCYPAKFEVIFTERDQCSFEWYKGIPSAKKNDLEIVWDKCKTDGFFYKVQSTDLNHKLKVSQFMNEYSMLIDDDHISVCLYTKKRCKNWAIS